MRILTILRWFISQTVRNACAAHKHHQRQLEAQRDVLSEAAILEMEMKLDELRDATRSGVANAMKLKMEELRGVAGKNLRPYPHAIWRECLDVVLVALAVALSVRTFFLQPFKIPSGSMQPTLFGVNSIPDFTAALNGLEMIGEATANGTEVRPRFLNRVKGEFARQLHSQEVLVMPVGWGRLKAWVNGYAYIHFVAPTNGRVEAITTPWPSGIFCLCQKIKFAGEWHTIWLPPDYGDFDLRHRAGLMNDHYYQQGQDILKLRVEAGDHLLVDRLSCNFCKPQRGDIVVFGTEGTEIHDPDEFYIKRLTVLPGERVQIGNDRHLIIDGRRLDAGTPHFEKVFGFDPASPPREDEYSGYVNGSVDWKYRLTPGLAPLFPDAETVYTNGPDSCMMMGDNTCNSSDSRTWGSVPMHNIIGKSFFVFWPISSRFGLTGD